MKILADFYLYNTKNENIEYNLKTPLSLIILHANKFIKEYDKDLDFNMIVSKWSELNKFLEQYGDIPLFKLLKIQKKFRICYGGYIKFRIIYNKIEKAVIFQSNNNEINIKKQNKFYLIYNYILKYLSIEDIINLSLINKYSYNLIINNKIYNTSICLKNSCYDEEEEKEKKLINFNKFFGGHSYNLYEVKKLGMYVGKNYMYLLIQSMETYNVEIMRLNKDNIDEHEIIFRDEWTNYYMFKNIIYQLKYTKEKVKLNKINKNEDDITLISINVSNLGDSFDSEYLYNYEEINDIFVVSSDLKIYKLNHKKKKLKLYFDESKKLKLFQKFVNGCKIRQYYKYYIFIKDILFLSLIKFFIYDIVNKKLIICFPEIRGVELVLKINMFYYIVDYRYVYLLSNKNFEINYKFKKYHNELCMNQLLIADPFLNNIQKTINDFILNNNIFGQNNNNNKYKNLSLKNLFFKFNKNYLCSDYYNDEKALYIKLIKINHNLINSNDDKLNNNDISILGLSNIRIDMNKFIKKLKFEENIKEKTKKEIIRNTKCHLFFNGLNDLIINVNDLFWIYSYNTQNENGTEKEDDLNNINKINDVNNKKEVLTKINKISVKTNEIIRFHNIVFYDKIFIVWKQKSLKILYCNLNNIDKFEKEKDESSNKVNKNVKLVLLEDIEDESKDIYIDTPIFLFHSFNKLFLISDFSEENTKYDLFEIKIINDKVVLVNNFIIEMNEKENIQNDEILIYAKLILELKYLVIFTSYAIYLFKIDNSNNNVYKEVKRKKHYIIGYFSVRQLNEEETCFIAQDDRTKKCLFFDIQPWT